MLHLVIWLAGTPAALLLSYTIFRWLQELAKGKVDRRLPVGPPYLEILARTSGESAPEAVAKADARASGIDNQVYDTDAEDWWDPSKPFSAGLHAMTRRRGPYFADVVASVRGWTGHGGISGDRSATVAADGVTVVRVIDVGCGGGILSETLGRELLSRGVSSGEDAALRIEVTGVDLAPGAVREATKHAKLSGLDDPRVRNGVSVEYKVGDARALSSIVDKGSADVVVIADVLEHITDLPQVLAEIASVLRPGGVMLFDTVNRTFASLFLAIVCAQELPIFGFLPSHTHEWRLFVTPAELTDLCRAVGLSVEEIKGFRPVPNAKFIRGIVDATQLSKWDYTLDDLSTASQYIGYCLLGESKAEETDETRS